MTIAFSQTARDVVTGAMRDIGVLRLNRQPTAAELSYGVEQLDLLLKDLAADGIVPWTDMEETAVFPAGTSTVTLDPRPVEVSEARVLVGTYERPLLRYSNGDYDILPNKTQQGVPLAFELVRTPTAVQMRLWPVPSADTTVSYSYSRVIEDVSENAALDVPQLWGAAVREMLKARLTAFGPVDPNVLVKAEMAKTRLLDFERPESYRLGGYGGPYA